jgi:hypothetical protein
MIAEVKAESVRDKKRHDVNMSRLTGDYQKWKKNDAIQNTFKIEYQVEGTGISSIKT